MVDGVRRLVGSRPFQAAVIAVIVLAGVLAGVETSPALVAAHGPLLHALDRLVLGVFIVEIALKLVAAAPRPWRYFADPWNGFDCAIVGLCLLPAAGPFAACASSAPIRSRPAWRPWMARSLIRSWLLRRRRPPLAPPRPNSSNSSSRTLAAIPSRR